MNLHGQTALITGAGRGIGRGIALEFAQQGADLVLNDRPNSPDLAATARAVTELGRACHIVEADAFSRAGCEQMVETAVQKASRIDILVSNPAYSRRGAFLKYSPEQFEATIRGTLTGGFLISQLVAGHMVERGGGGKIVFVSSVHAEMPMARCFAYGAAKAGLNQMMRSIAVELVSHRINVNAIEPGWIDTPGEHATFTDETIEKEGQKLPWKRMGQPEDIAKAAAFLCSADADYITGTVLPVDGLFRYKHCTLENMTRPRHMD